MSNENYETEAEEEEEEEQALPIEEYQQKSEIEQILFSEGDSFEKLRNSLISPAHRSFTTEIERPLPFSVLELYVESTKSIAKGRYYPYLKEFIKFLKINLIAHKRKRVREILTALQEQAQEEEQEPIKKLLQP